MSMHQGMQMAGGRERLSGGERVGCRKWRSEEGSEMETSAAQRSTVPGPAGRQARRQDRDRKHGVDGSLMCED